MTWFKFKVLKDSQSSGTFMWLVNGLQFGVIYCTSYEINNCTSKDQNPAFGSMAYYGII